MLAPLLFLIGFPDLVPARWPSADPATLDLLRGSPINCVLLEPQHWNSAFLKTAADRHIATLGVIRNNEERARALTMTFNGVVVEGDDYDPPDADGVVTIRLPSRGRMKLGGKDPIIGTIQGLWPGIEVEHGGTVSTGPTSAPWINTNTGFLRFVTAAANGTVWLGERPPPRTVVRVQDYGIAIADAAIAGARWIVALDDDLQTRLLAREPKAVATWAQINTYLHYFEDKREWRAYRPYGVLAVVEDAGSGGLLSSGLLDMLAVQHTAARALPTRRLSAATLRDAKVVLNVDAESLVAQQMRDLEEFVASGGKLVNPPAGWHFPKLAPDQVRPTRKQMDGMQPIWETTYFATVRKNFGARTFNTASMIFDVRERPDGKSVLVHLLNFTDYPSEDIAVQVLGTWRKARLYSIDAPPRDLPVYAVKDGTGVDVDRIALLGTVVME